MKEAFILFFGLMTLTTVGSWLIGVAVHYHLKRLGFTCTTEQLKEIKWLISSVVTILTGLFSLLYFLLSH